ncbi:MAG: nucleotidyltransferase domain-containing protein, partial [Duncaniella sp.]|nr:nucleotidyltransferase domain-containing protein [Duncaniella sp.]
EDTNGKTIEQAAKDAAKSVVYGQVHEEYVKRNGPQSKNEFFVRKMLELNPASVALSGTVNPYGQAYAELNAMERYGAEHRGLDIVGMIAGMAIDPTTYLGGWAGNIAFKNATRAAGKMMAKKALGDVAGRYAATTLAGRIIGGMAAGGANFGTFEAVKDAERQLYQGGYLNPETGEMEGFSFGSVLNSGVHGIGMGAATGVVSPLIGNVADKAVKATTSTAGKAAMRGTEVLASTLAEGTVFSIPEWISGDQDAFDVWTDNMAMMAGFKLSHAIKTAPAMIRSLRPIQPTGDRPLSREERIHNNRSFAERLRERLDQSPSDIAMSKEEREELKRKGYGDLSNLFAYDPEHKSRKTGSAQKLEGDYTGITGLSRTVDYEPTLDETGNPTFDGYSEMERLMEDESVSEATRAKAYYILTGRMLPISTVTGWSMDEGEDGTIYVSSINQQGGVVTSRKFSDRKAADREIERINRQSELNTIDIGEQYRNAEAQQRVMAAAINDVSPGADPQTVYNIYEAVRRGDENVTEEQRHLADMIDEAIERNTDAGAEVSPAGIRERISQETGVDIDKAIRKEPGKRTEAEKDTVNRYVRELFPEHETYEPTPEEAEADRVYEEGRLLYGRFEQGDPEAQAEIDAISLRMTEAHQLCEEAFGDEAEVYMAEIKDDPWGTLNDPELSSYQKDAVLYYINAKAALDGVLDASNEAAADKRQRVQEDVARRTHKKRGVIVPATMKSDGRGVYIISGEVVMFPDGSGVDVAKTEERNPTGVIYVLDETGEYKPVSADQILTVGETIDPQTELQTAYEAIDREQEAIISAATERISEASDIMSGSTNMDKNSLSLQENESEYGNRSEQDNDGSGYSSGNDGRRVAVDSAGGVEADRDRSDIRVYEEGLGSSRDEYSEYGERTRRNTEAERLIGIAHQQGQYIPKSAYDNFGKKLPKRTGESEVYINKDAGRVYKVKDPAAKSPMKGGVQPEDAIYEHLVHNKYFPETRYQFEGISDDMGDLRIVLSQGYINAVDNATDEQIEAALAEKGLYPEGNYRYGNEEISVTDVTGDNALLGADGKVYFIDPIIDFKKPVREIIGEGVTEGSGTETAAPPSALAQIPVDEHTGDPILTHESVDADTAWEAATEFFGTPEDALAYVQAEIGNAKTAITTAEKAVGKVKPTGGMTKYRNDLKAARDRMEGAKNTLAKWQAIEEAQKRRKAEEAAAIADRKQRASAEPAERGGGTAGEQAADAGGRGEDSEERAGGNAGVDEEGIDNIPEERIIAPLSESETDEYGRPFVISSDGSTIFGDIEAESGLKAAPIRLSLGENWKDNNGKNHGYGLLHIEAGHGEQIRNAGFESVQQFVENVAQNYTIIKEGAVVAGKQTYLLEVSDSHNNTLFVQLSRNGKYWNINSAGIFKKKYSRNKPEVHSRPALGSGKDTDTTEVNSGHSKGATAPAGNSSMYSRGKDNALLPVKQGKGAESSEKKPIAGLEGYTHQEVKDIIRREVEQIFSDTDIDAEIVGMEIHGSRSRGDARPDSDLDIVLEYKGDMKEYAMFNAINDTPIEIEGIQVDVNPIRAEETGSLSDYMKKSRSYDEEKLREAAASAPSLGERIAEAEATVNTEPTEAQKEAGNYRKGHVNVEGFDVTIEQPKGSVRRGKDAAGNSWESKMNNTYGYIRGTEGVDGAHIDVYLSSDIDGWNGRNVFVVDQYNPDDSFDEHKVMLGFNDKDEAFEAYLSNYEAGWEKGRRLDVTTVNLDDFEKWIESS